jgi:hypothetical protein
MGSCHVEGEPSDLWLDCGVFDFSSFGLGMDLRHPSDLMQRRVSVRLPAGASLEVTLTGEVRSANPGPDGVMRVGIEFVDLSKTERAIVDRLKLGVESTIGHRNNLFPGARSGEA